MSNDRAEAALEFIMDSHQDRASRANDEDDGLLGKMRTTQHPNADHPMALAAIDQLMTVAGGRHRLGQTRWRTVLRRTPLSQQR
ncbi:hypothetical protein ACFWCB_05570 [Streptomyces sp. NPDC060048]|uniref:hypothetical protein n=1 Tax=unclassified Streptomyces TaxID=2593676 RepID=UPI00368FA0E7